MSLSRADNPDSDRAALHGLDLLFAAILHVLVVIIIAALVFWQQAYRTEPLKRIEVAMISAKELAKMQHQARHKPKNMAKPKLKPVPKPTPAAKDSPKAEDSFDPFAPLTSTSDSKQMPKAPQHELADLAGKQLSKQEMDRYIALIQAAVQQKWKVPASINNPADPLVEMRLQPDGSVASVKLLESSGNRALDDSLIRAIQAAAPFDLPQKQFEFFRINRIRFHPLK